MFAELMSSEDIKKAIIDYLGEDVKDLKRLSCLSFIRIFLLNSLIEVVL